MCHMHLYNINIIFNNIYLYSCSQDSQCQLELEQNYFLFLKKIYWSKGSKDRYFDKIARISHDNVMLKMSRNCCGLVLKSLQH